MRVKWSSSHLFTVGLLLLAVAGCGLIWYSTRWGAGLLDDSMFYLTSARNLATGNGLSWPLGNGDLKPLVHFPPMFPFAVTLLALLRVDVYQAARLVNAVAFAANICLVGWLVKKVTQSIGFALLGVLLFICSDVLIEVHSWALSEPLYISFCLLGLSLLAQYISQARWYWLVGAAITVGLAFLTRYIGFSLILTGVVALLTVTNIPFKRRLVPAFAFLALSFLPMAVWVARNYLLVGSASDRVMGNYLMTIKQFVHSINTLLSWILPVELVSGREVRIAEILAVVIIGLSLLTWRYNAWLGEKSSLRFSLQIRFLLVLQIIFHLITLYLSKSFFDQATPMDDRILSPILPSALILIVSFFSDLWNTRLLPVRLVTVALSLSLLIFYFNRTADLVPKLHDVGLGFSRKGWPNSATVKAIRQLDPVPIYSNSPWAIYRWTGRPVYPIDDLAAMRKAMQEQNGVLVVFKSIPLYKFDVTIEDLTMGLETDNSYMDGTIYRKAP